MQSPSDILVHSWKETPPIRCGSMAELDAALDQLHSATLDRLRSRTGPGLPLAVHIIIPGYRVNTGLGADESYACVHVEPFNGEYYIAVGDATAKGDRMFYGANYLSAWSRRN